MARYAIWDRKSDVITPSGAMFTPAEWIEQYPVAAVHDTVCSGGTVNGGIFIIYDQFVEMYEQQGCDFSACVTKQDKLDAIEAFEDAKAMEVAPPTAEERMAAALEAQVMMSMMDIEE